MAPSLSLNYSSHAAIYGGIAAGWSLDIPTISEDHSYGRLRTRSPEVEQQQQLGLDPLADDRFVSSLAGGRPLVPTGEPTGPGVYANYRAQNDTSYSRHERMHAGQGYHWRVRRTDGTELRFGEAARTSGCTAISAQNAPLTTKAATHRDYAPGIVHSGDTRHCCRVLEIGKEMMLNELLAGLPCWHVSAGGSAGSTFQLVLGDKIPRDEPVRNPTQPESFRLNRGAAELLVWCSWRLQYAEEVLASSDQERLGASSLRRLVGSEIRSVHCTPPAWDLCIDFSDGHRLLVFCDHVEPGASIAQNWELYLLDRVIRTGPGTIWEDSRP